MFAGLRWDALCDELLNGNVGRLDQAQQDAVSSIAASDPIAHFAAVAGFPPATVALALIADLIDDRLAQRFVKQAFKGLPVADWAHLRLWGQTPSRGFFARWGAR